MKDKKTSKRLNDEVAAFFKAAFCIDGTVRMITDSTEMAALLQKKELGVIIELNDVERGKNYLGYLEDKENVKKMIKEEMNS